MTSPISNIQHNTTKNTTECNTTCSRTKNNWYVSRTIYTNNMLITNEYTTTNTIQYGNLKDMDENMSNSKLNSRATTYFTATKSDNRYSNKPATQISLCHHPTLGGKNKEVITKGYTILTDTSNGLTIPEDAVHYPEYHSNRTSNHRLERNTHRSTICPKFGEKLTLHRLPCIKRYCQYQI